MKFVLKACTQRQVFKTSAIFNHKVTSSRKRTRKRADRRIYASAGGSAKRQVETMSEEKKREKITESRREFLKKSAATASAAALATLGFPADVDGCDVPITGSAWPSITGWEHRTIMHYLNAIYPGDNGKPLFYGDTYTLKSGGDTTPGAFSACALDVFYDPYYGIAGTNSNLIAASLDWAVRVTFDATYFYKASQTAQLNAIDRLSDLIFVGSGFQGAATLCIGAVLGAFENYTATKAIGWLGPNGGYYDAAKHPYSIWLKPVRMTTNGNLP